MENQKLFWFVINTNIYPGIRFVTIYKLINY